LFTGQPSLPTFSQTLAMLPGDRGKERRKRVIVVVAYLCCSCFSYFWC
jgi:hypothetical protein